MLWAPLPECPAFAVCSFGGKVYNRIERYKTGSKEYLDVTVGWDQHLQVDLLGVETPVARLVASTFRPIMFQEGYWVTFRDRNPLNVDLPNLNWRGKEDYEKRFWDEMGQEDVEWLDGPSDQPYTYWEDHPDEQEDNLE